MTEEQIKNLKVGDKIAITLTAKETNDHMAFVDESGSPFILSTSNIQHATLVTTPPTFEVGDTVRIVPDPLTGTAYNGAYRVSEYIGKTGVVKSKENGFGTILVDMGDVEKRGITYVTYVNVHCLKLVKMAEKDRYTIVDAHCEWRVCENWGDLLTVSAFTKVHHPNAKAAAEAECERLNKEWCKQQESAAVCDGGVTKGGAA